MPDARCTILHDKYCWQPSTSSLQNKGLPVISSVSCLLQNKDRVNLDLIRPAVDWRKTGVADASASAAVARA